MTQNGTAKPDQLPLASSQNAHGQPTQTVQLTEIQFQSFLRSLSDSAGSMAELARRLNVSGQHLGSLVSGRKSPGEKVLNLLGAKRVILYEVELSQGEEASDVE